MDIRTEALSRAFGNRQALRDVSISFASGELTAILGPSGCGKSTLLNILAGILEPTAGAVYFDGKDITSLPPEKRNLGFVFQNYALYPHLTVAQNIGYPLRFVGRLTKIERADRIAELAALVRVDELLDHRPGELSGGQQQRVAIARALAKEPGVVLMDEPLSNLDARLRTEMRTEIRRIQSESGVTMVLVTHDQEDALAVSDAVVVMRAGRVEQVSSPIDTYADPRSLFVADFIGEPPASQLSVSLTPDGSVSAASGAVLPLRAPESLRGSAEDLTLAIRADSASLIDASNGTVARVIARVASRQGYLYDISVGGTDILRVRAADDLVIEIGASVGYRIDETAVYYFDTASGERKG